MRKLLLFCFAVAAFLFSVTTVSALPFSPSDSLFRVGGKQATFVYKDYLVMLSNDGHAVSYHLPDGAEAGSFDLGCTALKPHCNVANTVRKGRKTYVYVSEWNGDRRLFVERIRRNRKGEWKSELVQTIRFSSEAQPCPAGDGYMDWVVDSQSSRLYSIAYKQGGEKNDYLDTPLVIQEYALPETGKEDVTLTGKDVLRRKELPSVPLTQDKEIRDGKLYITAGLKTKKGRNSDSTRKIVVIDLNDLEIQHVYDLSKYNREPEGLDFWNGHALLTFNKDYCFFADGKGWALSRVVEVNGRQGVATDGEFYYVSGSTALYKYSKDGTLILSNEHPFDSLQLAANHIGDIDVHDGCIYAGIETFMDGVGKNIQVAVFDASSLSYKYSIPWNEASGQVEVCGLAVNTEHNQVWMADWVKGTHLYCYDLGSGAYVGKVKLQPAPGLQQGICFVGGKMVISCDDGDAEKGLSDNLWTCDLYPSRSTDMQACGLPLDAEVSLYRTMSDFRRVGEIEGLSQDPATGELLVLANRGARIILGMPRGFYPGYDHEIHEIYVFTPFSL